MKVVDASPKFYEMQQALMGGMPKTPRRKVSAVVGGKPVGAGFEELGEGIGDSISGYYNDETEGEARRKVATDWFKGLFGMGKKPTPTPSPY
jgi:hypothetical protein|tara:strand:- start:4479 stop:4754 length:276 start_codon:yes stop_codon:yes gene_type:complete